MVLDRPIKTKKSVKRKVIASFLGDSGLNRVRIGLCEVDINYADDSMEVLSAVIFIAQSDMKYLRVH